MDFYVRQFRDMKVIPSGATVAPLLTQFARNAAGYWHALTQPPVTR